MSNLQSMSNNYSNMDEQENQVIVKRHSTAKLQADDKSPSLFPNNGDELELQLTIHEVQIQIPTSINLTVVCVHNDQKYEL